MQHTFQWLDNRYEVVNYYHKKNNKKKKQANINKTKIAKTNNRRALFIFTLTANPAK